MLLVYFTYAFYQPGDENVIIDTTSQKPYYNGCSIGDIPSKIDHVAATIDLKVFPNPTAGIFTVSSPVQNALMDVVTIDGKVLYSTKFSNTANVRLDIDNGMYFVRIYKDGQLQAVRKVTVQ